MQQAPALPADAPIGVFDSGLGGLSVLRSLRQTLPEEDFIYLADSGFAPYGERGDDFVRERSLRIAAELFDRGAKAVVVACNTATTAAIQALRARWPQAVLVGVEPALKPAALATRTGQVGVLATRGTLQSDKFRQLLDLHGAGARFHCVACDGLVAAIEAFDRDRVSALIRQFTQTCLASGTAAAPVDTLVLGCTHYPLVEAQIGGCAGPSVRLLDTGLPVARQTRRLLEARQALRHTEGSEGSGTEGLGKVVWQTTGEPERLNRAVAQWLRWAEAGSETCQALMA